MWVRNIFSNIDFDALEICAKSHVVDLNDLRHIFLFAFTENPDESINISAFNELYKVFENIIISENESSRSAAERPASIRGSKMFCRI